MNSLNKEPLNRYIKIENHSNWFLVLSNGDCEPNNFSENMQEKILRSQVCQLHHDTPKNRMDLIYRIKIAATRNLDYERLTKEFGSILIRPIGSYMLMDKNVVITDEVFDTDFPIDEYGEIVICENDEKAEYNWRKYLEKIFPNKKIITINYFDLRSDYDVERYFSKAEYITFSTTFSNYEWFKKLSKHLKNQKVIGYCHDVSKWKEAFKIESKIEVVDNLV